MGWLKGEEMACASSEEASIAYGQGRLCKYACF